MALCCWHWLHLVCTVNSDQKPVSFSISNSFGYYKPRSRNHRVLQRAHSPRPMCLGHHTTLGFLCSAEPRTQLPSHWQNFSKQLFFTCWWIETTEPVICRVFEDGFYSALSWLKMFEFLTDECVSDHNESIRSIQIDKNFIT